MLQIRSYSDAVIEFAFRDADGDPAEIDGPVTVAVDPASVGLVEVLAQPDAENPLTAEIRTFAQADEARLLITADVDLGEGVVSREFVCTIGIFDFAEQMSCTLLSSSPTPD